MYGEYRSQQDEDNNNVDSSSDSSSASIPNLQWFIMPETVLMTDADLNIQTTITPNTKTFNQSLRGQPFLKLIQDDEVQVIRNMVKKTQIRGGSPVTENIVRNRFMNDISYKLSPVLDVAGNIVQYLITRTMSSTPKETPPTSYMERKHSITKETKHSHDIEANTKSPVGNDKILSKFIRLLENVEPSAAAAIWLLDRSTGSTLHLAAFPTIRELVGVKVPFNKMLLDRDEHDITPTRISSVHNYLQTPELVDKLIENNITTQSVVQLYSSSQSLIGLLVFYGSDKFQPTPTLNNLVADAALLAESLISLEYDNLTSKKVIEDQVSTDTTAERNISFVVDESGNIQFMCDTVRELFGMSKSENLGVQKIEDVVDEKDRHRVIAAVTKSKQNPKISRYLDCVEFHQRIAFDTDANENNSDKDNGSDSFYLDLKFQGLWDDPAVNGCLIRGRDISSNSMTDRQQLESQKSLAMTNNSLNEGVIRTDSEGIIEYVNLAFIKLLGMDEWMLPRSRSANESENATSDQLSSSSASESTSMEGEYQNVSLMTTLVGTPVDDLLQLIQVVITEKSTPSSTLDSMTSTDVTSTDSISSSKASAIANSHTLRQGATATHASSPGISENSSQPTTEARLDSAASTDDDMFDDGFSYKTVLVDMKSMIKRTVASKQVTTLSDITYHQACNEDMYSDVLTQDMLDIVNFQLSEPNHGRNIGYLIRRGGETAVVAVEVSVNPLQQITYKRSKARAKSKNTDGVVLVFRNMTDIMRTQAANKQLADKSRWISVVTHELRSLVNGIIGMLDLVKTTDLNEEQRGLVDCMEVSTNALICLVSNTLDHSRLESGKVALEYLPFNIKERLHIVEELMNMMAKSKNVTFSAEIDDTLPEVLYSDFNRLFQILLNLISNAIKFSSQKRKRSRQGKVKLTVKYLKTQDQNFVIGNPPTVAPRTNSQQRYESMLTSKEHRHILTPHRSSKQITPPASPQKSNQRMVQVLFIVEDNGIGISPKNQEKLFQEFGQAEVSISRRFGGSGMGLFICKELVRLFNGTIGCESTLGEGSQFWFTAWLQVSDTDSTTGSDNNNNYFSMEQAMMVNINYESSCSNIEEASESSSDSVVNDVSSEEASDSNPTSSSKRKQQHKAKRKEDLRVLIAEDDRINRQVLLKFCNSLGYTNAHVVSDGRRAVKKCSKHHFDVILMDNSMPVMNGLDAIQAIREAQANDKKSYIILISGDSNIDYTRYRSLGIDGHLVKPIRMPDLQREIEQVSLSDSHPTVPK